MGGEFIEQLIGSKILKKNHAKILSLGLLLTSMNFGTDLRVK
jgi:hypothetical protein